jgi:hypothetical protein
MQGNLGKLKEISEQIQGNLWENPRNLWENSRNLGEKSRNNPGKSVGKCKEIFGKIQGNLGGKFKEMFGKAQGNFLENRTRWSNWSGAAPCFLLNSLCMSTVFLCAGEAWAGGSSWNRTVFPVELFPKVFFVVS